MFPVEWGWLGGIEAAWHGIVGVVEPETDVKGVRRGNPCRAVRQLVGVKPEDLVAKWQRAR